MPDPASAALASDGKKFVERACLLLLSLF